MIIYSKKDSFANSALGKYEQPIKMLIEYESDLLSKKGGIRDWLFNVEKSNHYIEGITMQQGFDIFQGVPEGEGAPKDTINDTTAHFIEHFQYMKEFTITAEMMEDAVVGIASDAKRRIQNFVRSYYNTINKVCATALVQSEDVDYTYANTKLNLRCSDGLPLFHNHHIWGYEDGERTGIQSNYYIGDFAKREGLYNAETLSDSLYNLAGKLRNMKDENGDPTGYIADTIILPGNKPRLEMLVKQVCGSDGAAGTTNNDVNIHYGNWNVIVIPTWQTDYDDMMIMSSEANKSLAGNLFFERVPLTVTPWVDHHTGNYNWTGRCRFGVGFGNYKHIIRVTENTSVDSVSDLD